MNPYIVLGISPSTSYEEAKMKYRKLVKKYHPDTPTGSTEKMIELKEAWSYLESNKSTMLGKEGVSYHHKSLFEIQ